MCHSCWAGDWGSPILRSDEIDEAAELIRHLYEDLREGTGGPLHAILDDMNIYDDNLGTLGDEDRYKHLFSEDFGKWRVGEDTSIEHREEIKRTCERILELFLEMPESHRAAAIGWYEGWAAMEIKRYAAEIAPPEVIAEEWRREKAMREKGVANMSERLGRAEEEARKLRDENHRLRSVAVDLCLCGKQGHQHEGAPFAFCIWCCPQCNQFQPKVTS